MEAVITAAVAVLGTLLGAIVTGRHQHRATARAARAALRLEIRRDRLAAIRELAAAASDHRTAMYVRQESQLRGDTARYETLRAASHVTRAALTAPLVAIRVLFPEHPSVHQDAEQMITTTYALRDADTADALTHARGHAVSAYDVFVTSAARALDA
ncbi:hypothetical protein [Streptomyces jumonjinensis]|uniref:hypothetical protein n=1 Tax=Streptomyces jumonjinensis TaxID=1945 RepID=UPI0037BAF7AD